MRAGAKSLLEIGIVVVGRVFEERCFLYGLVGIVLGRSGASVSDLTYLRYQFGISAYINDMFRC